MLYVTTRSDSDVYTCARALNENRGRDGGFYVPFRLPVLSAEELEALRQKSFSSAVAEMLNRLFGTRVTAWDVECAAGRNPVRLRPLGHKILVLELWHNPKGELHWLVEALGSLLRREEAPPEEGAWTEIGIRMALLCGIFSRMIRENGISGKSPVDISCIAGTFSWVMGAWYARQMGLPIRNIVCTCNENNALWELLHHGQLRTDILSVDTGMPDADVVIPTGLERLIHGCGGSREVERFLDSCRRGRMYCPDDRVQERLRTGLHVSVVSSRRVASTIPSVYGTHGYIFSPYGALAYGGLLDCRVRTGESRCCLVLAEKSPLCDADLTAGALGIGAEELKHFI